MRRAVIPFVGLIALCTAGCPKDDEETMTWGEASEALAEASASTQAAELSSTAVEISTNFTIATAVEAAAVELRTFIQSQLPCADISLQDATLAITYGAKPGNCTWRGQQFSGTHTVKLSRNDLNDVQVSHSWTNLSNGRVKVSGTATVTWSFDDKTRHVVHELDWTRLSDGRTGKGSGDRTQRPMPGGLDEGVQVEGARWWDGPKGHWDLAIQDIQIRWADPVPQSGAYVLVNPKARKLTMSFQRVDEDTIKVSVSAGKRSFDFNVNKLTGQSE